MNPRDLNCYLIGYEGGVVAYDFQKGVIAKCFEMTLPPGAPGGGSYQDTSVRTAIPPSDDDTDLYRPCGQNAHPLSRRSRGVQTVWCLQSDMRTAASASGRMQTRTSH